MRYVVLLGVFFLLVPSARSAEPPEPDFERVDHSKPEKALALCPKFGGASEIKKIAKGLKREDPLLTIRAVDAWINANFAYDAKAASEWRGFKRMRKEKTYGGCADHAVLFGHLTRAAGIPTVFVKTMDCRWIRAFVKGALLPSWSGHCFLEVYLEGTWALLDASMMRLYRDYKPTDRILPGCRYAYDKSHDPYAMVKSMRWELWKRQTRAYFKDFDLRKLPVDGGMHVRKTPSRVGIVANAPHYGWIGDRCKSFGIDWILSFNSDFGANLKKVGGQVLIVPWVGTSYVLPGQLHAGYLPMKPDEIEAALKKDAFGIARGVAWDGTRVVLLYARDDASMRKAVEAFTFE